MTTAPFETLLNWQLLAGSHEFPGPSGGTCINEAALVAAGFPYKSVQSAHDMPACFSRVISAFAIGLNDGFSNAERQRLIPFVTRLAGSADSREVEQKRAEYLVKSLVNNVISRMMTLLGKPELAQACADATTMEDCRTTTTAAARYAAAAAADDDDERDFVVNWGLGALEGVLAIGNQAEPIETAVVVERMDAIRRDARAMAQA